VTENELVENYQRYIDNMATILIKSGLIFLKLIRIPSPVGKMVLSDFNSRGFALADKIHALEGRRHEVGAGTMIETKDIFTEYGLTADEYQGTNQDVLVACRT